MSASPSRMPAFSVKRSRITWSLRSSSKKASSVPTTSAFSLSRWRTAARRRMIRSTPSAGRNE